MSNQGLPRIMGYPLSLLLTSITMKFAVYSSDSMLMMMSSSIPCGRTMDVSYSCNIVVVGLMKDCKFRDNIVYFVITLIAVPMSMRLLGMEF